MIDIKWVVSNKEEAIKLLKTKNNFDEKVLEKALQNFSLYKESLTKEEEKRKELNSISSFSSKEDLEKRKNLAKKISDEVEKISKETKILERNYIEYLQVIPNIPFPNVIVGKDETNNKELYRKFDEKRKEGLNHFDIFDKVKNLVSKDASIELSGARNVVYMNDGALLLKALEKLMLDKHIENGYKYFEMPVIVNQEALLNTGHLPKFEDDLYKLNNGQYLIPTSEVTLTNLYQHSIINEKELPIKITTSSNCFRSEAGSAGKDTRGIIRLHQFRKVELVKFGLKNNFETDFKEMVNQATSILDVLEIPYRVVELCTGDLGFGSAITYDIEVWLPGQKTYREISSVSCMSDFQTRRMKIRNDKKELLYSYNGSALALERTFVAVIENYYSSEENIIKIPKALQKYLSFDKI